MSCFRLDSSWTLSFLDLTFYLSYGWWPVSWWPHMTSRVIVEFQPLDLILEIKGWKTCRSWMILELKKDRITLYFWSVDWKANILCFVKSIFPLSDRDRRTPTCTEVPRGMWWTRTQANLKTSNMCSLISDYADSDTSPKRRTRPRTRTLSENEIHLWKWWNERDMGLFCFSRYLAVLLSFTRRYPIFATLVVFPLW